jgi:predicted nucleic acid-binding protein
MILTEKPAMIDRIFVDSDIWIYLFIAEGDEKSQITSAFLKENAKDHQLVISYQVLNEVCSVLKKKNFTEAEIRRVAEDILGLCTVCDNSGEVVFLASELREKYAFAYWDSLIAASAAASHCSTLISEGMQDGRTINGLVVKNIFLGAAHF